MTPRIVKENYYFSFILLFMTIVYFILIIILIVNLKYSHLNTWKKSFKAPVFPYQTNSMNTLSKTIYFMPLTNFI